MQKVRRKQAGAELYGKIGGLRLEGPALSTRAALIVCIWVDILSAIDCSKARKNLLSRISLNLPKLVELSHSCSNCGLRGCLGQTLLDRSTNYNMGESWEESGLQLAEDYAARRV